jgi:hypothetical protein
MPKCPPMHFEIIGDIEDIETIAVGSGIAFSHFCLNVSVPAVGGN